MSKSSDWYPSEIIEERRTMADLSFPPLARSGNVAVVSFGPNA
jgi:hypothetical protein